MEQEPIRPGPFLTVQYKCILAESPTRLRELLEAVERLYPEKHFTHCLTLTEPKEARGMMTWVIIEVYPQTAEESVA